MTKAGFIALCSAVLSSAGLGWSEEFERERGGDGKETLPAESRTPGPDSRPGPKPSLEAPSVLPLPSILDLPRLGDFVATEESASPDRPAWREQCRGTTGPLPFAFAWSAFGQSDRVESDRVEPEAPGAGVEGVDSHSGPPRVHRPHLLLGGGSFSYHERNFTIAGAEGLRSRFYAPAITGTLGWEFLVLDHQALGVDIPFFVTETNRETWKDSGIPAQQNNLQVWRMGFELNYLASSWNRRIPAADLAGTSRWVRMAAGLSAYYRHQHFTRDRFVTFDPPDESDARVQEKFDMLGGELLLEFEAGPRNVLAFFARGRGGGGYVTVTNDVFGGSEEDARLDTAGVQGTIDLGIVSEFARNCELRAGFRWHRMDVFETTTRFTSGGTLFIVNLPDNTTEMQMGFLEAAFPF